MLNYEYLEEASRKALCLKDYFQTATNEFVPIHMDREMFNIMMTTVGAIREINTKTDGSPFSEFYRDFSEFALSLTRTMRDKTLKGNYFVTQGEVDAINTAYNIIENRATTERIRQGMI